MMRSGERLLALAATKSFGVPGESYLAVLDALHGQTLSQMRTAALAPQKAMA